MAARPFRKSLQIPDPSGARVSQKTPLPSLEIRPTTLR